jgi:hypothetical protein
MMIVRQRGHVGQRAAEGHRRGLPARAGALRAAPREELWSRLGHEDLIAHAEWPVHDEALCQDDLITVVVQVNGKKRDELEVPRQADKAEVETLALAFAG